MRLERLEIAGFGRLRDVQLDFAPGVTVILGGNEAGKSTVVRAVRAALYGLDAGGQGRAVDRSGWHRWAPWTPGPYGLALSWSLEDGRRFRVARRLDQRDQPAQVQEVGGGDVSDAMRVGRSVAPGQVLLGIDETVFTATAWLGDEGLRTPTDGPGRRVIIARLQEAIERLADTGREVTAQAAIARLREAEARIGSERRSGTPLGAATIRLRQLNHEVEEAQRRAGAVAADRTRLEQLDATAATATRRSTECERAWLAGRLARIGVEREAIAEARSELRQLEAEIAETVAHRDFPLEDEERAIALGGELQQATATEREAQSRALAADEPLRRALQRRSEIADGLLALGEPVAVDAADLEAARDIERGLAVEVGSGRRVDEARRGEGYGEQLRRQIAATGLGGVPPGDARVLAPLFDRALAARRYPFLQAAMAGLAASATAAVVALIAGIPMLAIAATIAACSATVATATAAVVGDDRTRARRELARQFPSLDTSPEGLEIAASRLPALERLQDELRRHAVLIESDRVELEANRTRAGALAARAEELVRRLGIAVPDAARPGVEPHSLEEFATRAGAALTALADAVERTQCHDRLQQEDAQLADQEAALRAVIDDATRRRAQSEQIEARLRRLLDACGIAAEAGWERALAAHRDACQGRRRHDAALARQVQLERRLAAVGSDEPTLARRAADYTRELIDRGGDPAVVTTPPLASAELDALERQVNDARQVAAAARAEAAAVRSRLSGLQEGLPCLADLVDERTACAAARERSLHQLSAIQRATELIAGATRDVHRDLAPRLAESVAGRLSLITEGRYRSVNVDTDHFDVSLLGPERCELIPLDLVSRGTRDQVSLLLRLALSELLGDSGEPVPLILDEPLLSADRFRAEQTLEFLCRLSGHHQVVITTSEASVADRLEDRLGARCAILELAPAAPARRPTPDPAIATTPR